MQVQVQVQVQAHLEYGEELLGDQLGVGPRQVDLVDDRQDGQVRREGEEEVGDGLGLHPLVGVHQQQDALAGAQAPRHLVAEVHVPRRVDQVEEELLAVVAPQHRGRLGLHRDPPLPLHLQRVEHLLVGGGGVDGAGLLEHPVGEGGLAVVHVRHDAEVPDPLGREGGQVDVPDGGGRVAVPPVQGPAGTGARAKGLAGARARAQAMARSRAQGPALAGAAQAATLQFYYHRNIALETFIENACNVYPTWWSQPPCCSQTSTSSLRSLRHPEFRTLG